MQEAPANSAQPAKISGYRPELDAVRFIAFLVVFLHHLLAPFKAAIEASTLPGGLQALLVAAINAGARGTALFFALSGYLITQLLLAERAATGTVSIRRFYARRILRIWPLYLAAIGLGLAVALMVHAPNQRAWPIWFLLLAGNVYTGLFGFPSNSMFQLWSISIEEQFYLVWPWAARAISRFGLFLVCFALILLSNATLFELGQTHATSDPAIGTNSLVEFEMFAVGILLALRPQKVRRPHVAVGILQALAGIALWIEGTSMLGTAMLPSFAISAGRFILIAAYAAFALGSAALLDGFCRIGGAVIPRSLAYLGRISYGLYVFHILAIAVAGALAGPLTSPAHVAAYCLGAFLLTVAAAVLSYTYFEAPFLRLKRRFEWLHSRPI